MSVPIRLVERGENRVINLDCINYFMTIKRTINVFSAPVIGMRYGLDLNRVQAEIRLTCILRDDDCSSADLDSQKSSASIDFSTTTKGADYLTGSTGQVVTDIANFNGAQIQIQATDETVYTATFDTSTSSNSTSGDTAITVGLSGLTGQAQGSDVASRLKAALETSNHASNGFTAKFTMSLTNGRKAPILADSNKPTVLNITQKTAGMEGNNDQSPAFIDPFGNEASTNNTKFASPAILVFSGGTVNNCRSAGDKAQDLLANVVNSNFTGITGEGGLGDGAGLLTMIGGESTIGEWMGVDIALGDLNHKDYVVGLQIPYNSLRHASLGSVGDPIQGYEPRNFMMITGHVQSDDQGSAANTEPASVDFDPTNKYTGISGTLTECELKYDAGATTYEAILTFQPIDVILGG